MIDFSFHIRNMTRVQMDMILTIGEDTKLLREVQIGSRPDTIRTLKSLFYFIDRVPNEKQTFFRYRLNDNGRAILLLLQAESSGKRDRDLAMTTTPSRSGRSLDFQGDHNPGIAVHTVRCLGDQLF